MLAPVEQGKEWWACSAWDANAFASNQPCAWLATMVQRGAG